jgi:hypothetical protein
MSCPGQFIRASFCIALLSPFVFCVALAKPDEPDNGPAAKLSFTREVAPLFVKHCIACHGPKKPEGEFQLHTFTRLMTAGASGEPAIIAGKPDESYLVELLTIGDADVRMPKEQRPLSADEIDLIRRWIAEGGAFDGPDPAASLESFVPKPPQPQPPDAYPRPAPVTALAFSPDGSVLASGGYHEVLLWRLTPAFATGSAGGSDVRDALTADHSTPGQSLGLTGARASGTPVLVRRIQDIAQRTHAIAYNADGSLMAVAAGTPGRMGEVILFDARTGERLADLCATSDEMFDVEFSRDGSKLAACGADRTIRIFDAAERKELRRIEAHADWVMAVAWNADGSRLASAGRDKVAKVIDPATGTVIVTYPGHDEQVYDVVFSGDGQNVFSASHGRELHRWATDGKSTSKSDVRKKETGAIMGRTSGEIYKLALLGKQVLAVSGDGKLSAFEAEAKERREPVMVYGGAPPQAFALAIHESSGRIAVGGFDGRVMIYESGDSAPWSVLVAAPGFGNK